MKKCMETDKPLVSIVLAAYKPREDWFIMQLESLNNQTYPNLNLYIYDDCPECPVDERIISKYITNFNYTIIRADENRGSNYAFEQLAKVADGEYLAFCDQDDKWMPEKINVMMQMFNKDVTLVCSDLSIMDGSSIRTHKSITDIKKRIEYRSGHGLAQGLMFRNFVTGCAMIVKKDIAVKAIPYPSQMYHDQWIAIIAALHGKIVSLPIALVMYRQHSSNQSQTLKGAYDKKTYRQARIEVDIDRFEMYKKRLKGYDEVKGLIIDGLESAKAREKCYEKLTLSNFKNLMAYRHFYKSAIALEMVSHFVPNKVFGWILSLIRSGKI